MQNYILEISDTEQVSVAITSNGNITCFYKDALSRDTFMLVMVHFGLAESMDTSNIWFVKAA